MILRFLFLFGFLFMEVRNGFSDEVGRGGSAGSFLRMGLGARAEGMGGGSVALAEDAYTAYYNPAGLVFLEHHWFTATLHAMALDRRLVYVGYARSIKAREKGLLQGGFSVGWLSASVHHIDGRDFNGREIGSFSSGENCFFFSFALNPISFLSIGVSGKLLQSRFPGITSRGEDISALGFGFDFGLMFRPQKSITFGIAVQDIGSKYTWDTQKLWEKGSQTIDLFPKVICSGMALHLFSNRLIVTADLEKVEYWPLGYTIGTQIEPYKGIFLRGGIKDGKLGMGAGYRLSMLKKVIYLDYAFVPDLVAPSGNHVFTWSFIF